MAQPLQRQAAALVQLGVRVVRDSVALIGNDVQNTGSIIATAVTLAAGNKLVVDRAGS